VTLSDVLRVRADSAGESGEVLVGGCLPDPRFALVFVLEYDVLVPLQPLALQVPKRSALAAVFGLVRRLAQNRSSMVG